MKHTAALALLLLGAIELAVCGVLIGPPWRHRDRIMGWLITSVGAAVLTLVLLLIAVVLHLRLPLLDLGLLALGAFDVAFGWVMLMLIRARRRAPGKVGNSHDPA